MNRRCSPIRSTKPAVAKVSRSSDFTLARAKMMPRSDSVSRSSSSASTAVRSTSMFASAFNKNHSTRVSALSTEATARRLKSSALAKNSGCVVAIDQQTCYLAAGCVVVYVMYAGYAWDIAQNAIMRAGNAPEQVQYRQADGYGYPVQHIQDQDCDRRGQRQEQLAATESGDPAKLREIDQPECGENDDRAEGS